MSGPHLDIQAPQDVPVIVFRRVFQAPPRLVFEAWTEPGHLRHWRGPRGLELVVCEVDLRVGGGYRFLHRAPTFEARDLYLTGGAERGLAQCHELLDELLSTLTSRP